MTNRVTNAQLQSLIDRLNTLTGHSLEPYTKQTDGTWQPNSGSYILSGAYGGVKLEQLEGSGVRTISTDGYGTKRQLESFLRAYIAGIEAGRKV